MLPLAVLLGLVTFALLCAAALAAANAARLALRGVETEGEIVAHAEDSESSLVQAVVAYRADGATHHVRTNVFVDRTRVPIGASRRVVYLAEDPRSAVVAGANRFAIVASLALAALVTGAAAAGLALATC